ncbi:MAG: hypothetical protein WBD34_07060 [Burkholderiaceae bacterium]
MTGSARKPVRATHLFARAFDRVNAPRLAHGLAIFVATTIIITATTESLAADRALEKVSPVLDPYHHRAMFVGSWLMSRPTRDGGEASWLVRREPGGTYKRTTRLVQANGKVTEFEDVGRWGIVNKTLFTIMRGRTRPGQSALNRADPSDPYSYDAFWVQRAGKSQLKLISMHSGESLSERRVADSFAFPRP